MGEAEPRLLVPPGLTPGLARADSLNDWKESQGTRTSKGGVEPRPGHVTAPEWARGPHPTRRRPPQRVVDPHWPRVRPIEIGHLGSQRSEPQPNLLSRLGCNEKGQPRVEASQKGRGAGSAAESGWGERRVHINRSGGVRVRQYRRAAA